jgi:hypothetical protein
MKLRLLGSYLLSARYRRTGRKRIAIFWLAATVSGWLFSCRGWPTPKNASVTLMSDAPILERSVSQSPAASDQQAIA